MATIGVQDAGEGAFFYRVGNMTSTAERSLRISSIQIPYLQLEFLGTMRVNVKEESACRPCSVTLVVPIQNTLALKYCEKFRIYHLPL